MIWRVSWRADPAARRIADGHYNRQSPGADQFVPPGRCKVFVIPEEAFWITSWPFAEFVKHQWGGAWVCSAFRNERPDIHLSSSLILRRGQHTDRAGPKDAHHVRIEASQQGDRRSRQGRRGQLDQRRPGPQTEARRRRSAGRRESSLGVGLRLAAVRRRALRGLPAAPDPALRARRFRRGGKTAK